MFLSLKREVLKEVDTLKYLGVILDKNGGIDGDVLHRVNEGTKMAGAMSSGWRVNLCVKM